MLGLKMVRSLQTVEIGDRILVRWSNLFGLLGSGHQVFKISTPRQLGSLDQIRWLRRFKYGFLYRGWSKDASIYRRIDPRGEFPDGKKFAYIIVEGLGAFVLEDRRIPELLEGASLHPKFKEGGLFVKVM